MRSGTTGLCRVIAALSFSYFLNLLRSYDDSIFLEGRIFVGHSRQTAAIYAICDEGPKQDDSLANLAFAVFELLEILA